VDQPNPAEVDQFLTGANSLHLERLIVALIGLLAGAAVGRVLSAFGRSAFVSVAAGVSGSLIGLIVAFLTAFQFAFRHREGGIGAISVGIREVLARRRSRR
jgi:hypothetical protein